MHIFRLGFKNMLYTNDLLMFILFILVNIEHSYVLCEDKATQISVPQADKCFQINNNECDEKIDPEELQRKRSMFIMSIR